MADKYANFEELASSEIEGQDYKISYVDRGTKILIIGPHAGSIEPGTTEIVLAVAGADLSYYLFEGIKASQNRELHITSTNFDEPRALRMIENSETVIAIHGEGSENNAVYLGGRNQDLQKHLLCSLIDAGFTTEKHDKPWLQGTSPANICNRCASKSGVQLELGKGLRNNFFSSLTSKGRQQITDELAKFATAIRRGIDADSTS